MKRGIAFGVLTALLAAFLAVRVPLTVYAERIGGYYQYGDPAQDVSMTGVYQGDSSTDFVNVAPIATIYIDEAMIDTTFRRNEAEATPLADTTAYPQNKGLQIGPVMSTATENFGVNAGNKFLYFDNRLVEDDYKIKKDKDNHFPGKLASFRFKNAAETEGGMQCDVVFTYSDAHIVVQSTDVIDSNGTARAITDADLASLEKFSIAGGNLIQVASTYRSGTRALPAETGKNMRYGLKVDVNVQVMQAGTNTPVAGNFYFRIVDIDVPRPQNGFISLHDSSSNDMYSEHILLKNGYQPSPYAVYVPGGKEDAVKNTTPGYKCKISYDSASGYTFQPTVSDSYPDTDGSFYSGFLTVAENTSGVNLTAWSAGCGSATVRTKLLAGFRTNTNIVYNVLSSTSAGGNIQTTSEGNPHGDLTYTNPLDPNNKVIGPSKLMVAKGREVKYTLTPKNGFSRPKEIIVDGKSYTGDELAALFGLSSESEIMDGVTYVYSGFTGSNAINADHTIHVNWYHEPAYAETYRYANRMYLPPEVLNTIPPNSAPEAYPNGYTVFAQLPGATSLTIDGFIYTFNGWQAPDLTVAGADVEFVGSWTITPVPVPVAATPPPTDPGTSAFVPPPAPVEEAEEEVVEITEEEMLAAQLAVQKKMLSPETGDDAPVAALVFVMLLSGSVCLLAARRKRRLK